MSNDHPPTLSLQPSDAAGLTFVLPVSGGSDIARVRRNLLPSIDAFFQQSDVAEILVIGTDQERSLLTFDDVVSTGLARRIRIVSEKELAGEARRFRRARGWHKQQVLKLFASERIGTRLYCTLDADMYLVRPCGLADWVRSGRCIYNRTRVDLHPRWWRRAARRLGYDQRLDVEDGFGVTPSLMVTPIVRELVGYLNSQRGGVLEAIRGGATEYTLYWLYLNQHYDSRALYDSTSGPLYGRCLWKKRQVPRGGVGELLAKQFQGDGRHYFSLIQSTSGLVDESLADQIHAHIRREAA